MHNKLTLDKIENNRTITINYKPFIIDDFERDDKGELVMIRLIKADCSKTVEKEDK